MAGWEVVHYPVLEGGRHEGGAHTNKEDSQQDTGVNELHHELSELHAGDWRGLPGQQPAQPGHHSLGGDEQDSV